MPLLLAFIAVPIIEIALFIQVGGAIGLWPTILIVILTAVAGAWLLRRQGVAAVSRLQAAMARGEDPSGPLAHGALLLVAGVLLLTPGFFTDAVGLALMSPAARAAVIRWAGPRMVARVVMAGGVRAAPRRAGPQDGAIDADYRDVTDEHTPPR
jgi:UPF0716 protein FxsA